VRTWGGIEVADSLAAEVDDLAVASLRGGRSFRSSSETMQRERAVGDLRVRRGREETRSIEPHSSDSTWPKAIQRRLDSGRTRAIASDTSGNMRRGPVWNSSGWSALDQELFEREGRPGAASGTQVRQAVDAIGDLVDECFHERLHSTKN